MSGRSGPPAVVSLVRAFVATAFLVAGVYLVAREISPGLLKDSSHDSPHARVYWAWSALALMTIGVISILLGSFLMIRAGRAFLVQGARSQPTPYVDVWSRYRVTPEQIRAATQEPATPAAPEGGSSSDRASDSESDSDPNSDTDGGAPRN